MVLPQGLTAKGGGPGLAGRGVRILGAEEQASRTAKAAAPGILGSPPSVWGVWDCQYQLLACQKDQASQALP
ncbi:hypothetical protein GCM10010297_51790 [Streptomyces malachitofuscus]|nr:hypothetical protein GCM10010297_51790 [Streptomyces malachitofuscus]